jgi:hypothetical protein
MKTLPIVWMLNQDHSKNRFKREYTSQNELSYQYNKSHGKESSISASDISQNDEDFVFPSNQKKTR